MKHQSSKRRMGVWRSSDVPNLTDIMEYNRKIEEDELKKYLLSI
jgi:hypothetical protein